jgi:hypothetical protein
VVWLREEVLELARQLGEDLEVQGWGPAEVVEEALRCLRWRMNEEGARYRLRTGRR